MPVMARDVNVPPGGTRGVPIPRGASTEFSARLVDRWHQGGMTTQGGVATLLLETTGARSGEPRHAALGYLEEPDGSWLVIASMAGASYHPAWLHNLARQPDASIRFDDGRRFDVRAETLHGDELAAAWERIAVEAPEYVGYNEKTDRQLAVVRLRRRESDAEA